MYNFYFAKKNIMPNTINEDIENAKAVLKDQDGNPTQNYSAYLQYETEYNHKKAFYNQAEQDALKDPDTMDNWPVNSVPFQDEVNQAFDKWISLGYKDEIEKAMDILNAQGIAK